MVRNLLYIGKRFGLIKDNNSPLYLFTERFEQALFRFGDPVSQCEDGVTYLHRQDRHRHRLHHCHQHPRIRHSPRKRHPVHRRYQEGL